MRRPVYYQVAATGHGTIFGSYGSNLTNFSSGQNRKQGEPLVFQANPETGYQVSRWLVNGTEVREGSPYRIGATTGSATQTLSIDAFSIARDAKDGQLKVEVEFANQFSVIRYSAGENGSVTARTGGGSPIANNAKVTYGSSVTFTAVPQSGYMVEKWTVNGTDYTWPGAGKPYREEELTLSGLDQTEYTVTVSFVTEKTFTAAEPTLTDGQGNPVSAGTVAITWARTGETVAAGSVLPKGTALTYTVTFTDTSFNTVNRWEYSTDGEIWKEGGSGGSFTLYDTAFGSDSAALYVRAVVAVANTHRLSWKILGLAAEDGDKATLTASSIGTELTSGGSYAANTPVDFTLTLDGSYDLGFVERKCNACGRAAGSGGAEAGRRYRGHRHRGKEAGRGDREHGKRRDRGERHKKQQACHHNLYRLCGSRNEPDRYHQAGYRLCCEQSRRSLDSGGQQR